jgi:hypothetical protein
MFKFFISLLSLIPIHLNAVPDVCHSDPLYYKEMMLKHQEYYSKKAGEFSGVDLRDIHDERDRKIFYLGCAYSLEIIIMMDE